MSKKTDAIYDCLNSLEDSKNSLESIIAQLREIKKTENVVNDLLDLEFNFTQNLRTLRFWIDSLYKYNGKSTSILKKNASQKNGKKGGRPPKEITEAKLKINELENELIPELERNIMMADSNEDLKNNQLKYEKAKEELELYKDKVYEYKRSKALNAAILRL